MINFNVPPFTGKEMEYMRECVENQKICGDGGYTRKWRRFDRINFCPVLKIKVGFCPVLKWA